MELHSFSENVHANRQAKNYPSFKKIPSNQGPMYIKAPPTTPVDEQAASVDLFQNENNTLRGGKQPRTGLWRKIQKAFQGAVYDLKHLKALPGKTALHRLGCVFTRQNRWQIFLLLILVIVLTFVIGFGLARMCGGTRSTAFPLNAGGKFPMIGADIHPTQELVFV